MQCQSQISKDFYRIIRDEGRTQCKRVALYKIDDKCLCANHASLLLLKQAVEAKVIEVLDIVQRRKKY